MKLVLLINDTPIATMLDATEGICRLVKLSTKEGAEFSGNPFDPLGNERVDEISTLMKEIAKGLTRLGLQATIRRES